MTKTMERCPAGYGRLNGSDCARCKRQFYSNNQICTSCPRNTSSTGGTSFCNLCKEGDIWSEIEDQTDCEMFWASHRQEFPNGFRNHPVEKPKIFAISLTFAVFLFITLFFTKYRFSRQRIYRVCPNSALPLTVLENQEPV